MPKAGIQGRRSTNWYSAPIGSKPAHRASVAAKVASATPSAIQRTAGSSAPSREGTHSRAAAPARGRKMTIESRFTMSDARQRIRKYASTKMTPMKSEAA